MSAPPQARFLKWPLGVALRTDRPLNRFNLSGEIPQVAAWLNIPYDQTIDEFQSLRRDSSSGRLKTALQIHRKKSSFNLSGEIPQVAALARRGSGIEVHQRFQSLRRDSSSGRIGEPVASTL